MVEQFMTTQWILKIITQVQSKSWCSYQQDIATKQSLHKPVKWPFTDAILAVINPLFQRLAGVEFLEGCKSCHTQNPNEAANHVIWGLASKEQYVSPLKRPPLLVLAYVYSIMVWSMHI